MARWAGVQKVSRPIVRCQEMSQMTPTITLVEAKRTAYKNHGTDGTTATASVVSTDEIVMVLSILSRRLITMSVTTAAWLGVPETFNVATHFVDRNVAEGPA